MAEQDSTFQVVKQLTPEEQIYLYDQQMAKSAFLDPTSVHTVQTICVPTNQQQGFISTKFNSSVSSTFPEKTTNNNVANFAIQVDVGQNKTISTANTYLMLQYDLFMRSTVERELNPATAIFGKEYYVSHGKWNKKLSPTTRKQSFSVTATCTPTGKTTNVAAVYSAFEINGIALTGTPTFIDGLYFSQTSNRITINGTELTNAGVHIYGTFYTQKTTTNELLINNARAISLGLNVTTDAITANGIVATDVSGIFIANVPNSLNQTQQTRGFGSTVNGPQLQGKTVSDITCAPFILNPTGLFDSISMQCGNFRDNEDKVYQKGIPEQKNISCQVQQENFPYTMFDVDEDNSNLYLDTRWKNYEKIGTDGSGYVVREYLAATNVDGTPCLSMTQTNFAEKMYNVYGYDDKQYCQFFGTATTGTNTATDIPQYAGQGFLYIQSGADQAPTDVILFKKTINMALPLNLVLRKLQNQELYASALKQQQAIFSFVFLRQTTVNGTLGGEFQQGSLNNQVMDYNTGSLTYPDTNLRLNLFDSTYTGLARAYIISTQSIGQLKSQAINNMQIIHQNVSLIECQNPSYQALIGGTIQNQYIQTSHESVQEVQIKPTIIDQPNQSNPFSMFYQRQGNNINSCQFCDIWNSMSDTQKYPTLSIIQYFGESEYKYGGQSIQQNQVYNLMQRMLTEREAQNITSHYKQPCSFGNIAKYFLTYGITMTQQCQQEALLGKLNLINDGYNTIASKIAFSFRIWNYFQTGAFDQQDQSLTGIQLLNQSYTNQYLTSYKFASTNSLTLLIYVKYDMNLYYQPQTGDFMENEKAIGEM